MASPKEKIKELLESQPEDASYDEILREIVFEGMVEKGLSDSRSGNVISNDSMAHRIKSWQK